MEGYLWQNTNQRWKWDASESDLFATNYHFLRLIIFCPFSFLVSADSLLWFFLIPHLLLHHHLVTPNAVLVIWGKAKTKEVRFSLVAMPWKHIRWSRCLCLCTLHTYHSFFRGQIISCPIQNIPIDVHQQVIALKISNFFGTSCIWGQSTDRWKWCCCCRCKRSERQVLVSFTNQDFNW